MRGYTLFSLFAASAFAQQMSTDGTCGRFFGTTCDGSAGTGTCCGANNLCGSDATACGSGCQADYGICNLGDMSAMSSSAAPAANNNLGAAGLGAYSMPATSSSMPTPTSSTMPYGIPYSKPASMIPPSSMPSSMPPSMSPANANAGMKASPSPSMAMDGLVVPGPSASASMSMPPPSMAWAGQGHVSKGSMAWAPEYNATVTVTNCSGKASPTTMPAWNGTMPNTTMAMPTGHTCNGGCHKPDYSNGAPSAVDALRFSTVGLVLLGVTGFVVLLG